MRVAVSDPQADALFAPMMFEDDTLPAGNYWWWIRIYDAASNLISTSAAATGTIS
ncbi:hypothetical protein [Novosphingobium sp. AP12]|uniref:hypothetical protein n=1 Tax=Novosphingobium sp. AP12 TaxID=1144305 RepID=UPI0002D9D03D|nr:hypothetical protein [Novosphingobium sp. AP12]